FQPPEVVSRHRIPFAIRPYSICDTPVLHLRYARTPFAIRPYSICDTPVWQLVYGRIANGVR
ncbi:MAG: hypothetical protein SO011_01790, partial [Prevotella sp.]|nr:hypothetical protein [Prevotella sp.]